MKSDVVEGYAPATIYVESFIEGLKPDPILTVSEWADRHRILSRVSSAEPGQWNTDRTPYSREIMDALSVTSPYTEVVWQKGAQIGATECGNNWIGYVIDHAPGPMLSVMPNLDTAKRNSKIRIEPLIKECPRLREKIPEARTRDSGNTTLQKDFPGGTLIMGGANSAASLRSMPIRYLYLDEEDGYPISAGKEGDPVNLAIKRTDTFSSKKKIFHTSTPTIEGQSKIESNFSMTDQRRYFVPCPDCGHMQWLQWQQVKWDNDDPQTARYECVECGYHIKNWQKTKMLAKGEWRSTSESVSPKLIGFHLSGLYSPVGWLSWEDCVAQWLKAHKPRRDIEKLQTFINTVLGETWADKGEAPEWEKLYNRREPYELNSLPNGICFLTAGVDVQADRIEVEVVGWGRYKRSWSVDYRVFDGDTSSEDSEPWGELQDLLAEVWTTENGVDLAIKKMAVDSGYNTQTVYSWVRKFKSKQVVAVKGSETASVAVNIGNHVDIRKPGRRIVNALKLYTVGVSILKKELYGWLKMEPPREDELEPHGYCHFPQYDEEHFKRLTSETLETKFVRGHKRYEWVANGRNEQLDCRVYARAAACLAGIDRFKDTHWDRLEAETCVINEPNIERQEEKNVPKSRRKVRKRKVKRRKSKFT